MTPLDRQGNFKLLQETDVLVFERLGYVALREESTNVSNSCE